jgi:uncharacterized membrane protein
MLAYALQPLPPEAINKRSRSCWPGPLELMIALHPLTVHFPLALLLVSSLFTLLALRRANGAWATSAYHCLLVGWLTGIVALLTGVIDAARQVAGPDAPRGEVIGWVNAHALANLGALAVYGQALLRLRRNSDLLADPEARRSYLWLHGVGAVLLLVGGWLGGRLVYGFGLGVAL